MSSKVFVGGLSWNTTEESLRQAFESHGAVSEVRIITDRETGRSRGFGFVTYGDPQSAAAAISELDGTELDGRTIRVSQAQDRPQRGPGGGGGGGGGRRDFNRDGGPRGGGGGGGRRDFR